MKIGILTYYGVHNHGAVLQANGLKSVLKSMGHDVEFLYFDRNYDLIPKTQAKKYKVGLGSISFYAKYFVEKGPDNILYNLKKNEVLKKYRGEKFIMGPRYNEFDGDAVVIGSDEVFSLEIGINPFLYGHGINANIVMSYAGCFGPTTVEDVKKLSLDGMISSGLNSMSAIGVRDQNSYDVVNSLTGREAAIVCDPVILYGYQKEQQKYTPKEKDYLLVYAYDRSMNDSAEVEAIKEYAHKRNLKIYSIAYHHKWCDKNIQATPNELLGWIRNAKVVITDTFHGSVLSIVCNTPMVVKLRSNKNKLQYLLSEYNLIDRIIENFNELEKVGDEIIDFNSVNKIVSCRRKQSYQFLKDSLEGNNR